MSELRFRDKGSFMKKLEELLEAGKGQDDLTLYIPNPDHDIEHLIDHYWEPSKLKFFTLVGGVTGCISGYAIAAWTSIDWPLVTGGKPFFSWPAYTVIAFELTILLGALCSFAGMLLMGRLPKPSKMIDPVEYGNEYVILIENEG